MIKKEHHKNLNFLIDGKQAYAQIIKWIKNAKQSIYINIFIWRDDEIGNLIGSELLNAANRGVQIFISKDKLGAIFEKYEENKQSFFHKEFDLKICLQGLMINLFYPNISVNGFFKQKLNNVAKALVNHKNVRIERNLIKGDHSKYYIIDEQYLIVGGINIESRNMLKDVREIEWNDYMIEMKDKIFVERLRERLLGGLRYDNSWFEFVLNSKLNIKNFEFKDSLLDLLDSAKKNVYIQMAYLGDKEILSKLVEISKKGIKVVLLISEVANVQNDYNLKLAKEIFRISNNKIKIYLCNNMVHAKMIDIDNNKILLGSANFNKQTTNDLAELDILVIGDNLFSKLVRKSINQHIVNSKLILHENDIKYNKFKAFFESFICS